jgi:hypothetical protein
MNIEDFLNESNKKYGNILALMALQPLCKFVIHIYERPKDFIGLYNDYERNYIIDNEKIYVIDTTINGCIDQLKTKYPHLNDEYGVKYYPLNRKYY